MIELNACLAPTPSPNSLERMSSCSVSAGVGSWAAEALARAGIGELTLVDFDRIAPSNLNRQVHALTSTIGRLKVEVMAERLAQINPALTIHTHAERLLPEALPDYLADGDFTIDCIDDVQAKVALALWHLEHGKRIVSSMGTGNKLGTHPFKIADISKTSVCPLARAVRLRLRKAGVSKGPARALFGGASLHPAARRRKARHDLLPTGDGRIGAGALCHQPDSAMKEFPEIISDYVWSKTKIYVKLKL